MKNSEIELKDGTKAIVSVPYNDIPVWIRKHATIRSTDQDPDSLVLLSVADYGYTEVRTMVELWKDGAPLLIRPGPGHISTKAKYYFRPY